MENNKYKPSVFEGAKSIPVGGITDMLIEDHKMFDVYRTVIVDSSADHGDVERILYQTLRN